MPTSKLAKHGWKILFILIGVLYLAGLGSLPLVGPDEPRYAQVAREMFARGDLITPTLGGMPWFEKPPLLYWMMMASYGVFGVSEFAARLGPAICGLLTAAFVFWVGANVDRRQSAATVLTDNDIAPAGKAGHWSALAFLSTFGALSFSRGASFDIVLTMTIAGALSCFLVWHLRAKQLSAPGSAAAILVGFYFFIGLSLLAKGLIGALLPLAVVVAISLLRREFRHKQFFGSLIWGLPLAAVVAGIWYVPMTLRHGWPFLDQFIIQHHFARFLTNKYRHPQPFYFYLPALAGLCAPWTLLLVRSGARFARRRAGAAAHGWSLGVLLWVLVPLLFFSFSGSKLPGYILPVLPAAALLIGRELSEFVNHATTTKWVRVTGLLLIALGLVGGWYTVTELGLNVSLAVLGASAAVAPAMVAVIFASRRKLAAFMLAFTSFVALGIATKAAKPVAARESVRDLIQQADARGHSAAPVFYFLSDDRTAEFYAGGRLAYRPDGEPIRFEGAQDVAAAIRQRTGVGLVIMETRWEKQLTDYKPVETERIGSNGWVSLFVVRPR